MRYNLVGCTALALCGCMVATEPYQAVWRQGSTGAQRADVITQCQVQALQQVPRALATASTPVYRVPSNVVCTGYGYSVSCFDYGGQVYGGQTYTQDANEELRTRVTTQCLANRGYQVLSMPRCTAEQAKKGAISRQSRLPAAEAVLCLTDDGYVLK